MAEVVSLEQKQVKERWTWLGSIRPRFIQPEHLFYWRQIETALEGAQDGKDGVPTDTALLDRDWIARPAPSRTDIDAYLTSFSHACEVLEVNEAAMRSKLLQVIDSKHEFHTRECAERLQALKCRPLDGDVEEMFEAPRVVAVRDQGSLFASIP